LSRDRALGIAVLVALFAISLAVFAWNAWRFEQLEIEKGGKGYVSDEVWYVGSARTILVKIFKLEPRMPSSEYGVTVIYSGQVDYSMLRRLADKYGLTMRADYVDLRAFYVSGSRDNVTMFLSEAGGLISISDTVPGWMMPDHAGINTYINWEHPPLVKYIIAGVMAWIGDRPFYWRIPIVLLGALSSILLYLSMKKLTGSIIISSTSTILFIIDPLTRTLFSIALLDGFIAFTSILVFYLAVSKRYNLAFLTSIASGLLKFTGLFTLIPLLVVFLRRGLRRDPSVRQLVYILVLFTLEAGVLYLALLTLVSIPIIQYMGPGNWVNYSLLGSVTWHTSIKCNGPCPGSSAPWDWFLGVNAFTLYVDPTIPAMGFYPFWSTILIASIVLAPMVFKDRRYGIQWVFLVGILAGYIMVWLAGGKSQYSFYSVQLAPFIYANLVYIPVYVLNRGNLAYLARVYRGIVRYGIELLAK